MGKRKQPARKPAAGKRAARQAVVRQAGDDLARWWRDAVAQLERIRSGAYRISTVAERCRVAGGPLAWSIHFPDLLTPLDDACCQMAAGTPFLQLDAGDNLESILERLSV